MRLEEVMEQLGLDDTDVAAATGVDRSTISRLRRGRQGLPRLETRELLGDWVAGIRKRRKLPHSFRLTWDHLL